METKKCLNPCQCKACTRIYIYTRIANFHAKHSRQIIHIQYHIRYASARLSCLIRVRTTLTHVHFIYVYLYRSPRVGARVNRVHASVTMYRSIGIKNRTVYTYTTDKAIRRLGFRGLSHLFHAFFFLLSVILIYGTRARFYFYYIAIAAPGIMIGIYYTEVGR